MVLELPWPPSLNHYWRNVNGQTLISSEGRAYRRSVASYVIVQRKGEVMDCRLSVHIIAYPPDKRRRDLDNMLKAALDALAHAGVYEDDSQIDDLHIVRGAKEEGGRLSVRIGETR